MEERKSLADWIVENPLKSVIYIGIAIVSTLVGVVVWQANNADSTNESQNTSNSQEIAICRAQVDTLSARLVRCNNEKVSILEGVILRLDAMRLEQRGVIKDNQKTIKENEKVIDNL